MGSPGDLNTCNLSMIAGQPQGRATWSEGDSSLTPSTGNCDHQVTSAPGVVVGNSPSKHWGPAIAGCPQCLEWGGIPPLQVLRTNLLVSPKIFVRLTNKLLEQNSFVSRGPPVLEHSSVQKHIVSSEHVQSPPQKLSEFCQVFCICIWVRGSPWTHCASSSPD